MLAFYSSSSHCDKPIFAELYFFCRENDYGCKLTKRFSRRAHMRAFSQEEPAWLTSAVKTMTWYAVKIRILLK
jgi:hypothetical protein